MIDKKPSDEIIDTIMWHLQKECVMKSTMKPIDDIDNIIYYIQEEGWYLYSIDENVDDGEDLIIFTDEPDKSSIPYSKLTGSIIFLDKQRNEDWTISCCRREILGDIFHPIDVPISVMRWFVVLIEVIDGDNEADCIEYLKTLMLK